MEAARERRALFDRLYSVVVLVKGFDGAVELLTGILLLVAPVVLQQALRLAAGELAEGSSAWAAAAASYLRGVAGSVALTGAGAIAFLIVHGAVKLVLVYCLIRRILRAYPWAIAALLVLTAVQVWSAVTKPSALAVVLLLLDLVVVLLVVVEYRRLLAEERAGHPEQAAR